MFSSASTIAGFDDELDRALKDEHRRQEQHLELIASENYTSPRVLEAQGSVLTNKYAEGYPGRRYYGGCEFVDVAEELAIERATATGIHFVSMRGRQPRWRSPGTSVLYGRSARACSPPTMSTSR